MCPGAAVAATLLGMITVESLTKKYGGFTAVDDVTLHRRARPGDRLPRPQRRRQVDHHADHGRPHPADLGHAPPSPGAGSPTCPTPAARSASCSTPPPSTPAAPAGRSSPSPSAPWACPRPRVDEMLDLVSLTAERGRPAGARLLARHAPAARHRHRPDRRPGGAHPRRAGQRARPGRHPLDARPAARLRRPGRHRPALLAPAARDRGHRRRHRRDRQRPDRRPGHQGRAARRPPAPSSGAATPPPWHARSTQPASTSPRTPTARCAPTPTPPRSAGSPSPPASP